MIPPVFVDENVGRKIKDALENLGFALKTHSDVGLPLGVSDEEWIRADIHHSYEDVQKTASS